MQSLHSLDRYAAILLGFRHVPVRQSADGSCLREQLEWFQNLTGLLSLVPLGTQARVMFNDEVDEIDPDFGIAGGQ